MSVRPAQKVSICNPAGVLPNSNGLLVTDEICVDIGNNVTREVTRYRLLDPATLVTLQERMVDILTSLDVVGTPVACPCGSGNGALVTNALTYAHGILTSTVNGVVATLDLRGTAMTDLAGNPIGYWLAA